MKLIDITKRAGRSIRQAKARTLLTSLAIGVGAFTITLALAAGAGGRQYAHDIITSNTNVQEILVQPKQDRSLDPNKPREYSSGATVSYGAFTQKLLQQSDITKLAGVQGVASVTPMYNVSPEYVTRAGQKKYQASVDVFSASLEQVYEAGNATNFAAGDVLVPDNFVSALGFKSPQAAIGQTIQLVFSKGGSNQLNPEQKAYDLTIRGVTKQSTLAISGNSGFQVTNDQAKQFYDYSEAGTANYNTFMAAKVMAKDGVDPATVKQSITKLGYEAQTAQDLMSTIFQFINVLQGILIGFGALAVLTSIFGIINTQYISVLERTQQIGLMKALGMRRRDVGRLFKLEAAWIGFLGGAIGSGVAIVVGLFANPWITDVLGLSKGTDLLIFQPWSVAAVIIGLMLVSVGAGILPARKAAKLDPIEALRTE